MFGLSNLLHYKYPTIYFPVNILSAICLSILMVPLGRRMDSIHPRFTQRYTVHLDTPSFLAACLMVSNSTPVLVTTIYSPLCFTIWIAKVGNKHIHASKNSSPVWIYIPIQRSYQANSIPIYHLLIFIIYPQSYLVSSVPLISDIMPPGNQPILSTAESSFLPSHSV